MVKLVTVALVVLILGIGIGYGVRVRADSGVGCEAATAYFSKWDSSGPDSLPKRLQALLVIDNELSGDGGTEAGRQWFNAFHQMQEQCN